MTIAYVLHVEDFRDHKDQIRANIPQNAIHFLTDYRRGDYYRERICGYQYRGVIIPNDANISEDALMYLLSRVCSTGEIFIKMESYHKYLVEQQIKRRWHITASARDAFPEEDLRDEWVRDVAFCKAIGIDPAFLDQFKG